MREQLGRVTVFLGLKQRYARPANLTLPELRLVGLVSAFDKPKPGLLSGDSKTLPRVDDKMPGRVELVPIGTIGVPSESIGYRGWDHDGATFGQTASCV